MLQADILEKGIGFLIVDSVAAACGGDPEKAESVQAYFNALAKLKVGSLHIAHITKKEDSNYPFGSIMRHNRARRTWFAHRPDEMESDTVDVGLFCRKVNDGKKPKPFSIRIRFEGDNGPVTFTTRDIQSVPELASRTSARDQIWHVLQGRQMSVGDIATETGLSQDTIYKVFKRDNGRSFSRGESSYGAVYGIG